MLLDKLNPKISDAIKLAREISMLWNKIILKLYNLGLETELGTSIYIGSTETHKVFVDGSVIRFIPYYDLEVSYEDPYYEMDLTSGQCYERIDEDTIKKVSCVDLIGMLFNIDTLEHRIKELKILKTMLEQFLYIVETNT
jgi:hypothetical protein